MHPNPLFRTDDRAAMLRLVDEIAFGMVFLTTPEGPRVGHTPLIAQGENKVRFHLSRRNALAPNLDGATALITINGPNGYVSPRWYDDRVTVPTWDYVAIELEGTVRQLATPELDDFLYQLVDRHETRLGGKQWSASEAGEDMWARQLCGILGFEMQISEWRPTFKLSQKKSPAERERIAASHDENGAGDLARAMRGATA